MQDRGRGVARVHGHSLNVPSYKEGNHLHRPYHFPQVPSMPHRLPIPHRRRLALLHYLHRTVSLSPTTSSSSPSSLHLSDGRRSWRHRRTGRRCGGAAGSRHGDRGCWRRPRRCRETRNRCGCGGLSSLQKVTTSSGAVHPDALVAPPAVEEEVFALA